MDYAALPPEVNSARMYTGPGAGPMLAAAQSWDSLASELSLAAADYSSAITDMTSGRWWGPASSSMSAAATPYVSWMTTTAAQAVQAASQAKAAAGAYEAAFAMTVPPPAIAANRGQLASLAATNLFGQNTPAIAATEAQYAEMWAQDAGAMYGYAASSATASKLTPFVDPPTTTSSEAGGLTQAAGTVGTAGTQSSLSKLMSTVPTALQGLASPLGLDGASSMAELGGMEDWFGLTGADLSTPAGVLNFFTGSDGSALGVALSSVGLNTLSSGFYTPGNFLGTLADAVSMQGAGAAAEAAEDAAGAAAGALDASTGGVGGAVSAAAGNAASIGSLSVPPAWTATSAIGPAASAFPTAGAGAGAPAVSPEPASMLGGMPFGGPAGRGIGEVPRYGFKPSMVMHPPAAG